MITWQKKGDAVVGGLTLSDGRKAQAVIVGPRKNPKGAVVVCKPEGADEARSIPVGEAYEVLQPSHVIDIHSMQERLYGDSGLKPPKFSD